MATTLVEAIQTKLGYPPLHKVDPNTLEIIKDDKPVNFLAQAVVPAVLIEMYKISHNEADAGTLIRGNNSTPEMVHSLFGKDYETIVEHVAKYSNNSYERAAEEIDKVTQVALQVIRENVKTGDGKGVKSYFIAQIAELKKYLPGDLHMGEAINDNTLDDRTNKMSGPMSNAMHFIERLFSDAGSQKKAFNPTDDTIHYK